MVKRTKIVATLGPASGHPETLRTLVASGLDVVRLNFSHGSHEVHERYITMIKELRESEGLALPILQDLPGPKIRIGDFTTETVDLVPGKTIVLTTEKIVGTAERVFIDHPKFLEDMKVGATIALDDGRRRLTVTKIKGHDVTCRIDVGGVIRGRRGVNFPGTVLSLGSLTAADRKHLAFGIEHGVEFVALSFVQTAEDIKGLRRALNAKKSKARIVAKIETSGAVEHIDSIIAAADAVMVARGDLAVEVPMADVPVIQKMIVEKARAAGKPVIVATQMLESMVRNPVPTRAEVSDVANAIFDGADAVMLSEEAAVGAHPVEAVRMMAEIARTVGRSTLDIPAVLPHAHHHEHHLVVDATTESVCTLAERVEAKVIVALTESGFTPRMLSRHRPPRPIVALTPSATVFHQLRLSSGVISLSIDPITDLDQMFSVVRTALARTRLLRKGDRFVLAAGLPLGTSGATNFAMVMEY